MISATTAIVAAWSASATSEPVIVAPTMTRRFVSTTIREVPAAPWPTNEPPALPLVSTSTWRTSRPAACAALEGEADGPDLGIGEDDAGRARAVRAKLDRAAEDRVGGQPALVLAHVREQDAAVDVADREQPVVAGNAEIVVDDERAVRLDPDRLEADARGAMTAAERREHLVRLERRAVVELDHHRAGTRSPASPGARAGRRRRPPRAPRAPARPRTAPPARSAGRRGGRG